MVQPSEFVQGRQQVAMVLARHELIRRGRQRGVEDRVAVLRLHVCLQHELVGLVQPARRFEDHCEVVQRRDGVRVLAAQHCDRAVVGVVHLRIRLLVVAPRVQQPPQVVQRAQDGRWAVSERCAVLVDEAF
eukprot:821627-Prymnesium_polylepis.4